MDDRRTVVETLRWPVWNARTRRVRAPWRLLVHLFVLLFFVVSLFTVVAVGLSAAGLASVAAALAEPSATPLQSVLIAVAVVASVWVAGRFLDRRQSASLGLAIDRRWLVDLAVGLAIGALAMLGVFLTEFAAGWVTVDGIARTTGGVPFLAAIVAGAVLMGSVGLYEELLVRGYWLTNLAEGFQWLAWVDRRHALASATILTSLVFGALHARNPNATFASVTTITVAGAVLAAGYLLSGRLALPIGVHAAWNFTQAYGFGFPTSGVSFDASIVAVSQHGPALFTGGRFGPEAGLVGLGWLLVAGGGMAWWVRRANGELSLSESIAAPRD